MKTATETRTQELKQRQQAPLGTPTDLGHAATKDIAAAMNAILADVFALWFLFEPSRRGDATGH